MGKWKLQLASAPVSRTYGHARHWHCEVCEVCQVCQVCDEKDGSLRGEDDGWLVDSLIGQEVLCRVRARDRDTLKRYRGTEVRVWRYGGTEVESTCDTATYQVEYKVLVQVESSESIIEMVEYLFSYSRCYSRVSRFLPEPYFYPIFTNMELPAQQGYRARRGTCTGVPGYRDCRSRTSQYLVWSDTPPASPAFYERHHYLCNASGFYFLTDSTYLGH